MEISPDECKRERQEAELWGVAVDRGDVLLCLHPAP